jgi:hypothetical protein
MSESLLSAGDIARLLHVGRQRVDQLSRVPGFPEPVGRLASGRVWLAADVELWRQRYRSTGVRLPQPVNPPSEGV